MAEKVKSANPSEGILKKTLAEDSEDKGMTDDEMGLLAKKVAAEIKKDDSEDDSKMEDSDKEEKMSADLVLTTMIESHRGNGLEDEKLRGDLRELRHKALSGSDVPAPKLVATAKGLVKAHFEKVESDGSDAGAALENVRPGSPVGFDVGKMLMGVFKDAQSGVENPDQLKGSPEAEMLKGIFGENSERAECSMPSLQKLERRQDPVLALFLFLSLLSGLVGSIQMQSGLHRLTAMVEQM